MTSFSINPEDGEATLFGKQVKQLQQNLVINENAITGTLLYVTDYTEFSGTVSEQKGNYMALKFEPDPADAKVTVEVVNGTKGPVVLDSDKNIVLLIKNKDTQKVKVTVEKEGYTTTSKTYDLTGLTLNEEA